MFLIVKFQEFIFSDFARGHLKVKEENFTSRTLPEKVTLLELRMHFIHSRFKAIENLKRLNLTKDEKKEHI